MDKTGTLTLGRPQITDVLPLDGCTEEELLALAASVERYSEHPVGEAVRELARKRAVPVHDVESFKSLPGMGVRTRVDGSLVEVGNRRMIPAANLFSSEDTLEAQGKTLLFVARDGRLAGILAAADTIRPEVPAAINQLSRLGIRQIELLTGDNEQAASMLAGSIGVNYRANLLPENKIEIVKEYQAKGHTVIMIGDGVNDAPALAQADVGIAMGAAGTDIAIEAAHIALMRDDWTLVPQIIRTAHRTMKIVRMNLGFTAVYNIVGISLAAFGILPPVYAAAAQSIPDLVIMSNSARLLKQ